MRIVICHNFYQQAGGEDRVFADEVELLTAHGHEVVTFTKHNDDVATERPWTLAARTIWNARVARELEELVRDFRADVVHFHNTLPLISPAAYYAARRAGAAVVQTLHNYRLVCPKATFFRNGSPCEKCLGQRTSWSALVHACYRDSRAATAAVVAMLSVHRARGTYEHSVDAYIALTQFARDKLVAGGLPARKMHVRPNFMLTDPGAGAGGDYAMYLGRLSPEKGIETLLEAWERYPSILPLLICGDGPLAPRVEQAAARSEAITWLPNRPHDELLQRLGRAAVMVLPSLWYEGFPKTIVEAYSKGTPVVASRLGSMAELVHEGVTGACFTPGSAADLAASVCRTIEDPVRLSRMRMAARRQFEAHYSASASYERLLAIYEHACRERHGSVSSLCAGFAMSHDPSGPAMSVARGSADPARSGEPEFIQPETEYSEVCTP
jgi:glycosyltransferase involved in cell wall biosynthesis